MLTATCPTCGSPMHERSQHCRKCAVTGDRNPNYRAAGYGQPGYFAAYQRAHRNEYRQQRNARKAVAYAVKHGLITKTPCAVCGDVDVQAHHHHGYDREHYLDVIWLCPECHRTAERKLEN